MPKRERDPTKRGYYWNNQCLNACFQSFDDCHADGRGGLDPLRPHRCIAERQACMHRCPRP
jgi:hypothetical protein